MKKELPQGLIIGVVSVVALIAIVVLAAQFFGGPGPLAGDDLKRAEMQAEAANARMQSYVPSSIPGAPPAPGGQGQPGMTGEQAARAAAGK